MFAEIPCSERVRVISMQRYDSRSLLVSRNEDLVPVIVAIFRLSIG